MKFFTQTVALLKKLGVNINPVLLLALVLLLPLVIAGSVWLYRWWAQRREEKRLKSAGAAAGSLAAPAPSIEPKALLRVWERFLRALPGEFRRAIADFQPFLVLGPALSGKTSLIQGYTDCQRQQNQFLESAVEDPNLQIYLGSSVLVLELSPALLKDTSTAARKALTRLFRRCFKDAESPVVVVPVRLSELARIPVDVLQSQAEVIRGKINLLSWVLDKRIEIRIALTHLDELPGYREFANFAEKCGLRQALPLASGPEQSAFSSQLEAQFAGLEQHLSLALTRLDAKEYRGVLAFLRAAPEQLPILAHFLEVLYAIDPLTKPPILGKVHLTSNALHNPAASPFTTHIVPEARARNPLLAHEIAAALLMAIPIGYFASGYYLERELWRASERALAKYAPATLSDVDEQRLRSQIQKFTEVEASNRVLAWFPAFFTAAQERVAEQLARKIRDERILPGLKRARSDDWAYLRTLYFFGVLYSSRDNELGTTVLSNLRRWSAATGLPDGMIRDYVQSSIGRYEGELSREDLPSEPVVSSRAGEERWALFLQTLLRNMERGALESTDFLEVQASAQQILADVKRAQALVERFGEAPRILTMLVRSASFRHAEPYERFFREFAPSPEYRARLAQQEFVLSRVASASLPALPDVPDTLEVFCRKLKLYLDQPADDAVRMAFKVGAEELTFDPRAWSEVVRASAIRRHVFSFIGQNSRNPNGIFFAPGTTLAPVLMNPRSDATTLFKGKGVLDGRFTARAFDKYVRPPLHDLTVLYERLPKSSEAERGELERFVYQEVEHYARSYVAALIDYYRAYDVEADFPDAVLVLITQMLNERSPFRDFITVITENTQLPLDGSRFDRPIAESFAPFSAWKRLTHTDENASSPELDKYRAILIQLKKALEERGDPAGEAPAGKEKEGEGGAPPEPTRLELGLTPAGRVALTLLDRNSKRSFRALIGNWLDDVGLQGFLREPFLAPLREIERIGRRDIEQVVADVWQRRMLLSLGGILRRFPFDPNSTIDAAPEDIERALHPIKGQFFELYREFVAPISKDKDKQLSAVAGLSVPQNMYAVIRASRSLAEQLWQPTGEPKPFRIRVTPVPFENSPDIDQVLTLVYLSTGSSSMFNFNQKAYEKTLEIDWTKAQTSQIGVQLTNVNTRRNSYPDPVVSQDSYWSFLHLLKRAKVKPPYWTWTFNAGEDGEGGTVARFSVEGDPWAPFRLVPEAEPPAAPVASAKEAAP